ncbi:YegP family protein [Mongoliimonas terrestris]|uniref:YegP family protein n=1 Tax=Mongoliimonas terrestris TaxID=1709001 RepID=UPI0009499F0F|nr:DUF1508 domain-containing protein [Mongoliimonas terrestris]
MKRSYPSYRLYKDKAGQWRWSFEASNGKTIGMSSEGYVAKRDCARAIEIMKGSAEVPVWSAEDVTDVA